MSDGVSEPRTRVQAAGRTHRRRRGALHRGGRVARRCSARRRLITYAVIVVVILVALYFVLPKLTGLEDSLRKIEDADPVWIAVALGFNLLSFAAYIALFRGILGGRARVAAVAGACRLAHLVPDHARRAGRHAAVLGGRSGGYRAHLLGAAPRRHGDAPDRRADGRVPRAALHGLPRGAGRDRASSCGSACSPARARSA